MGKNSYSPPPAPDPYATAQAQTGSNVQTAMANTIMGNANETGPTGTVRYNQIGTQRIPGGPADDGGRGGSTSYDVPQYERVTTLSPEQQQLYNQQTRLGSDLNQFAINQTGRLSDTLSRPFDASGLPAGGQLPGNAPNLRMEAPITDFSEDRRRVEEALNSRLNPQLDRDRDGLENRLVNQGFQRGSQPFINEMDAANRQATDARMQSILAGGQEQSRLADLAFRGAEFGNNAKQMDFGNVLNLAQTRDTQRERAMQEQLTFRNQPLNEISALMSGGQVSMPQFAQYKGGEVAGTPVGNYVYNSAQMNNQNYNTQYQQQQQQQNALMGGLFGLGSAAVLGPMGGSLGMFGGLGRR